VIQEITLNKVYDFVKPYSSDIVAIAGNGLVLAEGENHKRQRKMMNPAFNYNNIRVNYTFIR
jgi:cytochrome P450